jgi:hypothetical protein
MLQRLALMLVLCVTPLTSGFAAETPRPAFDPHTLQQMINDYRRSHGLGPVEIHPRLTAAAQEHSEDLARHDTISHQGSDGSQPWTRVERAGYPARFTAENVSVGRISMDSLIMGWRHSPPHNANLLASNARQMGIAMVYRPGTRYKTYWTLVLGAQRDADKQYKQRKKSKPAKPMTVAKAPKTPVPAPVAGVAPAPNPAPVAAPAVAAEPLLAPAVNAVPVANTPPVTSPVVDAPPPVVTAPAVVNTTASISPTPEPVSSDSERVTVIPKQRDSTRKAP